MSGNSVGRFGVTLLAVVPAKAGTHIPEAVVMGPRFRGDDTIWIDSDSA
jgi:hypothetical protein